jgi:hypothetical protein
MWPTLQTAYLYGACFALLHVVYGVVSGSSFLVFLGACGLVLSYGLARRSDSVRLGSIVLLALYVLMRVILGVFAWRDAG